MWRPVVCGLALVAALASAPTAFAAHSELLARWHLDAADGGHTPDDSGHDLEGEMNGAAIVGGGRFGNAVDLPDPAGSQVDVPDNAVLEPARVTVLAWVKLGSTPVGTHYVIAKGGSGCSGSSYALSTPAGGLAFHIYNGTSAVVSPNAGTGVWNDQWHAVAGTFDGTTVRLYVDGLQVGSGTPAATSIAYGLTTDDLRIGNYPASSLCGGGLVFQGLIDEARVYNRALSADEIAFLHGSGHAQPPNLPPPPVNTAAPTHDAKADPHPGDRIQADPGGWSNSPQKYDFEWLRCDGSGGNCATIAGASGGGYSLTETDLGSTIRVRVRATNASGTSAPADSVATKPVTPVPPQLAARLNISPSPSCVGSDTLLDARGSTGAVAGYRFMVTESRWQGFALLYQPTTTVLAEGSDPTFNWVPWWNANSKESKIAPNPFSPTRYYRDVADITLVVTDTRGATAQVTQRLEFAQGYSETPRTGCPPLAPVALTEWEVKNALRETSFVKNSVRTAVPCTTPTACLGTLAISFTSLRKSAKSKPVSLGATTFAVPPGATQSVTLKLNKRGRSLLKARRKLRVKLFIATPDALGKTVTRSRNMTLRAPRK